MLKKLQSIAATTLAGERKVYALLCACASVLYFRWVNFDVFSYGDWSFKYTRNLAELASGASWVTNTDFGSFNELLWRAPLDALFGAFAAAGMGINISEKFLVFWPIAITSVIAPYVLLRQLSFKPWHSVIGALFYATNTYFLSINPQGHGLLILAGNLLTLSFALFMRAVDTQSTRAYVWSALVLWLVSVADFRLFYIGAMLIAGFLAFRWLLLRQRPTARLFLFGLITVLLQLGWLAATAVSHAGGAGAILSRSLFGGEYWDLASALTLHYPFWTGKTTSWFIVNNIPLYFWALPAAAIVSLYINRKHADYAFFGLVAGLGILLSKQTSAPFSWIYPFLYKHLPGFSAFRESTKFYYLILLAYTVLLTALLAYLAQQKTRIGYRLAAAALLAFVVLNCLPYITGSMGKLLHPATIPADYQTVAHLLESDNASQYRTLWVPVAPRWSYYSTLHPRLNSTSLAQLPISGQADSQNVRTAEQIHNLVNAPLFQNYLSMLSVKYVFVPLRDTQNHDDFYKFYGDDRQFYIDTLNQLPFLKRVDVGTKDVAVYQNTSYQPYISATNTLFGIDPSTNLAAAASFLSGNTGQTLNFTEQSQQTATNVPSRNLTDVFGDIQSSNVSNGAVTQHVTLQHPSQLYVAAAKPQLSYTSTGSALSLQNERTAANVTVDSKAIQGSAAAKDTLATVPLQKNQQYFIASGDKVRSIDTSPGTHLLDQSDAAVSVLTSDGTNLLANGSFEQGPWQPHVSDCNPYDHKPTIGMAIFTDDAYDGQKAIELSAANHIACITSAPVNVAAGHTYLLTFRYQAPYAERIAYRVTYNNGQGTTFSVDTGNGTDQWRTVRQLLTVPTGVTSITVQLRGLPLPNYDNSTFSATTDYDDVSLKAVRTLSSINPSAANGTYQPSTILEPGNHTLTYTNSSIDGRNLAPNGDFETGTWQKKVDDCAADVDDTTPVIGMHTVSNAAHGKKALELSALQHVACTSSVSIPVQEGQTYLFSFAHQSPNTLSASYSLSFNDGQKTTLGTYVPTKKAWQNYHTTFTAPVGASTVTIKIYARSYSDSPEATINRYDNFQLLHVPNASQQYYVLGQQTTGTAQPKSVTFQTQRTYKTVTIQQASQPFYLLMSEAYNPGWQARAAGDKTVLGTHFEANAFQNGWYIDPAQLCSGQRNACRQNTDGSYDIHLNIAFAPQRTYFLGTIIGGATLILCVTYLAVGALRQKGTLRHIYRMRT